jgi:hypothetical protein
MPYPRTVSFQIWEECPRCGLDFPRSQLTRDYTGMRVCPDCYDQSGHAEELRRVHLRVEETKSDDQVEPII